jgi:lipopolysaccharide/colanic/teichoic acid biosynthesis glycosyltransferase
VNSRRTTNGSVAGVTPALSTPVCDRVVLNDESFQRTLSLERKRTERSRKPFLLMLLEFSDVLPSESHRALGKVITALCASTRATDVVGWYKNNSVVGVLFTEIIIDDQSSVVSTMMARVSETLGHSLTLDQFNQVKISFHVFPEAWDGGMFDRPSNPMLYPDFSDQDDRRKYRFAIKRLIDVVGSAIGLILSTPIFLVIAGLIKLTSEGPVFFRQQRIGQHGTPFTFLKFRTMFTNNDHSVHKEFVQQLIAGKVKPSSNGNGNGNGNRNGNGNGHGVYKIKSDPRVTRIGSFLRRSSLDELPQLINVLKGEMSLVGPRPPVRYEVEAYEIWHRGRLMEAKPGITGLWQVNGRSRVKFDEMVRLDIRYARTWSLWLDIKILLRTPHAVLLGEGAY